MKKVSLLILLIVISTGTAQAGDSNFFKDFAAEAASYFNPLEAQVESIDKRGGIILSGNGLLKGMRLDVHRPGEVFHHPVTNEEIGRLEADVGVVEVSKIEGGKGIASVIKGRILPRDIARITRSQIKALYFQHSSINYNLGEAFHKELITTSRFALTDTKNKDEDFAILLKDARQLGLDVLIYIDDVSTLFRPVMRLRLFWVSDGAEIFSKTGVIDYESIARISKDTNLLLASRGEPVITFELPSDSEFIAAGSLTDPKIKDVILVNGSTVSVHEYTLTLPKRFEFKLPDRAAVIYIDTIDLYKDGLDEIVITALVKGAIHSYVYGYKDGGFRILWQRDGFLRVIDRETLAGQDCSPNPDEPTDVYRVTSDAQRTEVLYKTLKGLNLYNFITFSISTEKEYILYQDKDGRLNLKDINENYPFWKSERWGIFKTHDINSSLCGNVRYARKYLISDRLSRFNKNIIVAKRKDGYSLESLFWNGKTLGGDSFVKDINGDIIDYTVTGNWVYVLTRSSSSKKLRNFFAGKTPFLTYLQVFSVNY